MSNISTPCIKVCKLNSRGKCEGCGRTFNQIQNWLSYSENKRKRIMERLNGNDPYLQLMNEMKTIRKEIKELSEKLDNHIGFIESVYRGLRHPLDKVKDWFK